MNVMLSAVFCCVASFHLFSPPLPLFHILTHTHTYTCTHARTHRERERERERELFLPHLERAWSGFTRFVWMSCVLLTKLSVSGCNYDRGLLVNILCVCSTALTFVHSNIALFFIFYFIFYFNLSIFFFSYLFSYLFVPSVIFYCVCVCMCVCVRAVSYTHLTLPTNHRV